MSALALLLGSALLGTVLVRRLRLGLHGFEHALAGILVGWMGASWGLYLVSWPMGGLRPAAVTAAAVLTLAAGLAVGWTTGRSIRWAPWLRADRVLLGVVLVAVVGLTPLFRTRMLLPQDGAIWSGGNAWGDMAMHAALASSFAYTGNVPPTNPLFPPGPLQYPYLPDFLTAIGMTGGLSMHAALVVTGATLAACGVGLFFAFARRIAGSEGGALVASLLLWLNGGLGFLYFLDEWRRSGRPLAYALGRLREDYCNMDELGLAWSNLVTDVLLPQRAALFGMAGTFLALIVFARAFMENDGRDLRRALLAVGVLVGALPRFHTHSFVALGLVSGVLFLLRPGKRWLWFWVPAVLLALPQVAQVGGHAATSSFVHLKPGWVAGAEAQLSFWIRNVGVVLLVLPWAWRSAPAAWRRFYLALGALQVFASIVMLTPNDWDNVKLMYVWYAVTCALVGAWLVKLAAREPVFAALLIFGATASGALALTHEVQARYEMFSADEIAAAAWARDHSGREDVFAAAPSHLQPVSSLAGRRLVLGYTGWMWTHGYDYKPRFDDLAALYGGDETIVAKYGVRWIYLGPREISEMRADVPALTARYPVAFRSGAIRVLDAR